MDEYRVTVLGTDRTVWAARTTADEAAGVLAYYQEKVMGGPYRLEVRSAFEAADYLERVYLAVPRESRDAE